ncbi:hypothetical protein LTR93_012381, partial [Exophiala xenobiotica]
MLSRKWALLPDPETNVVLSQGQNTELGSVKGAEEWNEKSLIILEVKLFDDKGKEMSRFVDWPEPFRYLIWPKETKLQIEILESLTSTWENTVTVVANHPVKGCWLEPVYDGAEEDWDTEPFWEDNMFDLLP